MLKSLMDILIITPGKGFSHVQKGQACHHLNCSLETIGWKCSQMTMLSHSTRLKLYVDFVYVQMTVVTGFLAALYCVAITISMITPREGWDLCLTQVLVKVNLN